MKWIITILVLGGLLAWAGIREEKAEDSARSFCDSVTIGESYASLLETAKTVGEDKLRIINDQSLMVGFTGIPPFSRHTCEVTSNDGVIDGKQYFYID